jgi:hypothetical protein
MRKKSCIVFTPKKNLRQKKRFRLMKTPGKFWEKTLLNVINNYIFDK